MLGVVRQAYRIILMDKLYVSSVFILLVPHILLADKSNATVEQKSTIQGGLHMSGKNDVIERTSFVLVAECAPKLL